MRLFKLLIPFAAAVALQAADNAPTLRFAGVVVDNSGKPVADATVACYQYEGAVLPTSEAEVRLQQTATTGTNGGFDFTGAPIQTLLFARKPGLAPAWTLLLNPRLDMLEERLLLAPPATIDGIVVDEAGKPVADAEVWINLACPEPGQGNGRVNYLVGPATREAFAARTDATGKFTIAGCPSNTVMDLAVSAPGQILREEPRQSIGPDTLRFRSGQQDIKLVLTPGGVVEGKVRSQENGQPLAGVRLSLESSRSTTMANAGLFPVLSDSEGKFRFPGVAPGNYRVRAAFDTNPVPNLAAETIAILVAAGRTTRDLTISATRGGVLEVSVHEKDTGKPMPRATVTVGRSAYQVTGRLNPEGVTLFRLPSGDYRVEAVQGTSRVQASSVSVELDRTNRLQLGLVAPPALIGIVRDPAGAPVPGLPIILFPSFTVNVGPVKTDSDGRYEMPVDTSADAMRQRVGTYGKQSLVARDMLRNLATAQEIEEDITNLDLRLEPGLVISGGVEDPEGKPVTNATVRIELWSGNMATSLDNRPTAVDARGGFRVTALPPARRYYCYATAKGYGTANCQIEETDTNWIALEPLILKLANQKLAGQVLDSDDKPVSRAQVMLRGQGQVNDTARTDEQGRFKFDQVCEGQVEVYATYQSSGVTLRAEAGDTNVVLRLGSRVVAAPAQIMRTSLQSRPLPELANLDLPADAAPAGKPLLVCLFDLDQRPSRRLTRLLADQHNDLKQKGLIVVAVQAAVASPETFKEWKDGNPLPFPVGRLAEKTDKSKWISEVESLPWLILTDVNHRVTAEGFPIDELDAKLKSVSR
jgi:protocatechuate 3,4-dioxygenase beta subunit